MKRSMKKIALPVTRDNRIDDHFGHCEMYSIYTINEQNGIAAVDTITSAGGCGCKSDIAGVLAAKGVTLMIAGGIGNGAINVLNAQGIDVIRGCSGNATEAVRMFLAGEVADSGESCRAHEHQHGDGHRCTH
jgi:predicted Fe-Mo cluster-binding NifX family protein